MAAAKMGDTVKVHYTGTLDDGTVFDSSRERDPMEFKLGEGELIPGFEKAIDGMDTGETKKIKIPVDEGYGPPRDDLILSVDRAHLPEGLVPEVGQHLEMDQQGQKVHLVVTNVEEKSVTLDANHPLAGKDLHFEIELVEVVSR